MTRKIAILAATLGLALLVIATWDWHLEYGWRWWAMAFVGALWGLVIVCLLSMGDR